MEKKSIKEYVEHGEIANVAKKLHPNNTEFINSLVNNINNTEKGIQPNDFSKETNKLRTKILIYKAVLRHLAVNPDFNQVYNTYLEGVKSEPDYIK